MKRQALIYSVFSTGAGGFLIYTLSLCLNTWQRFGLSSTFLICVLMAAFFALLFAFYCWITYLFKARAVSGIAVNPNGFELLVEGHAYKGPVLVPTLKVLRIVSEEFSENEGAQKFTLFSAGGKFWITSVRLPLAKEAMP